MIFKTLTLALEKNSVNKNYFLFEVGYTILSDSLRLSGLIQSDFATEILNHLFAMTTESFGREHDFVSTGQYFVANPHVVNVIVTLVEQASLEVQTATFSRLLELSKKSGNAQNISNVGAVAKISTLFREQLTDVNHPLYPILFQLVKQIATYRVSPAELRGLLRLRNDAAGSGATEDIVPTESLKAIVEICHDASTSQNAPFLEINLHRGNAGLFLPAITHVPGINALPTDRPWPPQNGFSLIFWVRLDEVADQPANLFTLFCSGDPETRLLSVTFEPKSYQLTVTTTETVTFTSMTFAPNRWYHVALVCAKSKIRHSQLSLIVNGVQVESVRHPYLSSGPTSAPTTEFQSYVCARIGQAPFQNCHSPTSFLIAAIYFIDDLVAQHICQMFYQLGPNYAGNLQASLKYTQGWDYVTTRGRSGSLPRLRAPSTTATTSMIAPNGFVDFFKVSVPVISNDRFWISLHAREFTRISMDEALASIGGPKVFRAFSRETGERDPKTTMRALRNNVSVPPNTAILTGLSRVFNPATIATTIDQVGGMAVVIKIIADATNSEYFNEALKLLCYCIKQSSRNALEMKRNHSYDVLAGILARKSALFTAETLALLMNLVVTEDPSGPEAAIITNVFGFQHLIMDYQVWAKADHNLIACLYLNIHQLASKSSKKIDNISTLRFLDALDKLFSLLMKPTSPVPLTEILVSIITDIIANDASHVDFNLLGHFILVTVDRQILNRSEKEIVLASEDPSHSKAIHRIRVRNRLLRLIYDMCEGKIAVKLVRGDISA